MINELKIGSRIRQGEVHLIYLGEPIEAKSVTGVVVSHGEDGHVHVIAEAECLTGDELAWQLFTAGRGWSGDEAPIVNVPLPTLLRHEEHEEIPVPAGRYAVVRIREYDYVTAYERVVVD